MTATQQPDPATQVKSLRLIAKVLVLAGLVVGIAMPLLFRSMGIEVAATSSGFDLVWLALIALMISDFMLARYFWRRADRIKGSLPPASPP